MVVECNECHAKFRLDDDKITARGIKVRCSKCKHVFVVKKGPDGDTTVVSTPPSKPAAPPPPDPEPSFLPESDPEPEKDDDLLGGFEFKDEKPEPPPPEPKPGTSEFDDGLGDVNLDGDPDSGFADDDPGFSDDLDSEDFSLGDDAPLPDTSPSGTSGTSGIDENDAQDDFGEFDFDDEGVSGESEAEPPPSQESFSDEMPDFSTSEPEPAPPPPSVPASPPQQSDSPEGDSDFGGDDFGAGDFDVGGSADAPPPPPPPDSGGEGLQEFGEISFDGAESGESSATQDTGPPPDLGGDLGGGLGDDLGDDLGGGPPLDNTIGGQTADEYQGMTGGSDDDLAFDTASTDLPDTHIPEPPSLGQSVREPTPAPVDTAKTRKPRKMPKPKRQSSGMGKVFVILLILGGLGGGGFYLHQEGKLPKSLDEIKELLGLKKEEIPRNIYEIEVKSGSAGFARLKREDGKILWVVRGSLTNRYTAGRSQILIEAKARDGDEVRTAQAIVGPMLTGSNLKSLSIKEIKTELMKTLDDQMEPYMMLTDDTREFLIVFDDIRSDKPELISEPDGQVRVVSAVNL